MMIDINESVLAQSLLFGAEDNPGKGRDELFSPSRSEVFLQAFLLIPSDDISVPAKSPGAVGGLSVCLSHDFNLHN